MTPFAFYGTFTSGQPGHANLAGARLLERTRTAPRYRLYDVDGLPALVPAADGASIECELYDVDERHLARLAEAFVATSELAARGEDVSAHGGWPAYVAARAAVPP